MKLYGVWSIALPNGETHKWEPDEVLPDEERVILAESGYDTYEDWIAGVDQREASAVQTLVWFLRRVTNSTIARADVVFPHRRLVVERIEEPPPVDGHPESSADSPARPATSAAASSSPSSTGGESAPASGTA